ncbi:MAG TPA: phospholipase D-like domain-containing protein [Gemmatimonadales bacterium]|nr:phospholipase D-like domain-containing protein [Gemmatimonadales bacterium]
MAFVTAAGTRLSLKAYRGDAKTLLAFNLARKDSKNLAGFTIEVTPKGVAPYYLLNSLRFEHPEKHAQDPAEPATSTLNAPLHKFRWVHVPGSFHQGLKPFYGKYTYTVTPRYFDQKQSLQALDPGLSVSVTIEVAPFRKKGLEVGFTRGFTQSQAFVHHFGIDALIRPKGGQLLFDTSKLSGVNAKGEQYTFAEEYEWLGFTAEDRIFELLLEVLAKPTLKLDVFAYDLNEPALIEILLTLARQGRARIILDNAALHHNRDKPEPEDQFEKLFAKAAKKQSGILRGKFGRYAHDKVLIVSSSGGPRKVLTGSTNFSVTGLYVNSNHVLIFDDPKVAAWYAAVFEQAWQNQVSGASFRKSPEAATIFSTASAKIPKTEITFSPHDEPLARKILDAIVTRINREGKKGKRTGSVLFAVMGLEGSGAVYPALKKLHADQTIFSYGISDDTGGIALYRPRNKTGVLATGKPTRTRLPPPFNQVPDVGLGHQVHHKFIVCGFNGTDPVVYCGSSNLAQTGETVNGDNLIAIHDEDVATVFAIEALLLVDHFDFLDRQSGKAGTGANTPPPADKPAAAAKAGWWLGTTNKWVEPYYDDADLRKVDRMLFA